MTRPPRRHSGSDHAELDAPPAPLGALHAGRQRARAGEGQDPARHALILDLEDAVAPDAKEEARERVCAAAASGEYGSREVTIRVNGLDTEWHEADLRQAAKAGPHGIVVPKINSAAEVHNIERALELHGAPEHTAIWAMLETPVAMLHAEEIAAASRRLTVLVMGTNDLAKELHAEF